jgi:Asp-tRNA(Asn)/Glu-tRNA(Gln) amidotransferase C subunit
MITKEVFRGVLEEAVQKIAEAEYAEARKRIADRLPGVVSEVIGAMRQCNNIETQQVEWNFSINLEQLKARLG